MATLKTLIGRALREHALTLAIAESCTGGMLSSAITGVPGSSDYFLGGVVAYSNEVKKKVLGVRPSTLRGRGAVSKECALEMADGVRRKLKADIGVSITGIAGPGGGSKKKPVGTVYIGLISCNRRSVKKFLFKGSRASVRKQSIEAALRMLAEAVGLRP